MTKGGSLLAISALFLSGVAIGALGMHLHYARQLVRPGAAPEVAGRFFGGYLERRLDLTDEQSRQIRRILEESRRQGADLRRRMRPDVEALLERTRAEIEALLTPDQRRELEEMRHGERRGLEQLLLGPPPHSRRPGDDRGRWRENRPLRPRQAPPPVPASSESDTLPTGDEPDSEDASPPA
jgi:Spy/CpxP family protein refolding chaperone